MADEGAHLYQTIAALENALATERAKVYICSWVPVSTEACTDPVSLWAYPRPQVDERELSYNAVAQEFEFQQRCWEEETCKLKQRIAALEKEVKEGKQDRQAAHARTRELKAKNEKIDELQRVVQAISHEREDLSRLLQTKEQVVQSQAAQVEQLSSAKERLQQQVSQLEAALGDVDFKHQMALLQTQYEQSTKFLESKVQYLEAELASKTQTLLADRRASSAELLALRQSLSEAEHAGQVAQAKVGHLTDRVKQLEAFLQESRSHVSETEAKLGDAEAHFTKQEARYVSLMEEASRAREASEAETAGMRQELAEMAAAWQVMRRPQGPGGLRGRGASMQPHLRPDLVLPGGKASQSPPHHLAALSLLPAWQAFSQEIEAEREKARERSEALEKRLAAARSQAAQLTSRLLPAAQLAVEQGDLAPLAGPAVLLLRLPTDALSNLEQSASGLEPGPHSPYSRTPHPLGVQPAPLTPFTGPPAAAQARAATFAVRAQEGAQGAAPTTLPAAAARGRGPPGGGQGALELTPPPGVGGAGRGGVGSTPLVATPGALLGKTAADVYDMYMEMAEAWRQERGQVRRLEAYIETIAAEVAAKAGNMERERVQRAAVEAAHAALQESSAALREGLRQAEWQLVRARQVWSGQPGVCVWGGLQVTTLRADLQRLERERGGLQQSVTDQGRQLAQLLEEVSRLHGTPLARSGSQGPEAGHGLTADQLLTSSDIISARLVTFRTVGELVEQNRRLLALSRQLSADNERSRGEIRSELAAEWSAREVALRNELAASQALMDDLTGAAARSADFVRGLQAQLAQCQAALAAATASSGKAGGEGAGDARQSAGTQELALVPAGKCPTNFGRGGKKSRPLLEGRAGLGWGGGGGGGGGGDGGGSVAEVSGLQSSLEALRRELDTTRCDAAATVTQLQEQVRGLRGQLADLTGEVARSRRRAEDAEQRLREQEAALATEQRASQACCRAGSPESQGGGVGGVRALALEKARSEGLLQSAQQRLHELQTLSADLQKQLTSTSSRLLALEVEASAARAMADRAAAQVAGLSAERSRLQVEALSADKLRASAEASLRSSQEEAASRQAALAEELSRLRSSYDTQQTVYHESVAAATEQVMGAKAEVAELRRAKEAVDAALAAAKEQLATQAAQVIVLQGSITALGQQLSDVR
ncbi:hypothetical protein QJQ45_012490, partial [Haematococcus lacustris]